MVALLTAFALQGCTLPRAAPTLREIQGARTGTGVRVVPVTAELAFAGREPEQASFPAIMQGLAETDFDKLGPGDKIDVTVWERDGLGVFPATASGAADLGEIAIDREGMIYLPYAGAMSAAGLTASQLHEEIARKLKSVVIGPQVGVRLIERRSLIVTVQGDVAKPGAVPIDHGTQRLSGLLGLVAPNQQNPEQLAVTVRRGSLTGTVRLSDIYRDPAQDIALQGGDSIIVHAIVQHVAILGAAGQQGRILLSKRNFSVIDALGEARGLADSSADPRAVFLLRASPPTAGTGAADGPVIYQFDMRRPADVFLAHRFAVHDEDALLISDAPFTQVQKLLSTFSATLGTARSVSTLTP